MKYKIVYGETVEALEEQVKDYISKGWVPQGGLASNLNVLHQVMIKP